MSRVTVKFRDTAPQSFTAGDGQGAAFDLTGCTVRLLAQRGRTAPVVLATSIADPASGEVAWNPDGLLPVGAYGLELEVTRGDGKIVTFPSAGYMTLIVVADLA